MNETLDDIDINRKNLPIFLYNLDQHKHLILMSNCTFPSATSIPTDSI